MTDERLRREARTAVLLQYATAHDRWSEVEQIAANEGRAAERDEAHQLALIALAWYRRELDNPAPRRLT